VKSFANKSSFIRDFSKIDMPVVAKIIKGQHLNLGVPTLSNPNLQSTALFLNAGKKFQIIAQPIKIKEGRKTTNVGKGEKSIAELNGKLTHFLPIKARKFSFLTRMEGSLNSYPKTERRRDHSRMFWSFRVDGTFVCWYGKVSSLGAITAAKPYTPAKFLHR
jgi:hypothetical protein